MNEPSDSDLELQRSIHLNLLLAEGSMGRVFDGFAADLGQYFAVKVLRAEFADDPEMRARFGEEAVLMGLIDHPGSPAIFGKGENPQGLPFYAMKKIEGRTLADLLAERGDEIHSVPWCRRLIAILLDACETIAYAHEVGVVHRDIKPPNILIDRHQSVYVIDWGIAKRIGMAVANETLTGHGEVMGSPGYMAPEQADGHAGSAGPAADVFALGAILYEILTGRRPFGGTGGREEMLAAVHRDPAPPRRGNWWLPRCISRICMKSLHKDPVRRYSDARGMASELRAFLEGRLTLIERVRSMARIRPLQTVAAALVGLVSLTLFAGMVAQFWTDQRMAGKAMRRVAELDGELVRIAAEADTVRRQLDASVSDTAKRAALKQELHRLDARWIVIEFEALRLLASLTELRFLVVESEIHPLARERLHDMVKSLIEREQPALARGLIDTVLVRYHDGRDALGLREDDVAQLKRFAEQADLRDTEPKK